MKSKTIMFRVLILSLIVLPFTLSLLSVKANNSQNSISGTIEIKPMETVVLNYETYAYEDGYASKEIDWEFKSNKSNIGITVWAMDEDDYIDWRNSITPYKYILSNGIEYQDSGTWEVNHEDTWYICFINWDTEQETITLTYDVEYINLDFFEEYGFILIPVGVIVFVAIVAGVSKSQQQAKTRQQQNVNKPQSPYKVQSTPETQKSDMFAELDSKPAKPATLAAPPPKPAEVKSGPAKYCKLCGEKLDFDAVFCHACGSKLEG